MTSPELNTQLRELYDLAYGYGICYGEVHVLACKEFGKLVSDYYSHCGNSPKEHEEFFRPVIKAMLSRQWCFNSLYTDVQFTKNFSDNIIREKTKQLLDKSAS
jgi:hypothetical protein